MSEAQSQQSRLWRRLSQGTAIATMVAGLLMLTVACGGSSNPGVATLPTATATATAALTPGPAAYSACMRANGVPNYPELSNFGTDLKTKVGASGIDPRSASFQAAAQACQGLFVAPGPGYTLTTADQNAYLAATACMRSHGFPDFPDPVFDNGGVRINIPSSIDQTSTQFANAVTTCQKLIPAGLPYSGTDDGP